MDWLPLFHNVSDAEIDAAIGECQVLVVPEGSVLLRPGIANDCVYLLLSGQLGAQLGESATAEGLIPIRPGECVGEMSAIDGKPVSAMVSAVTESRILEMPQDVFWHRVMVLPGVARNLLVGLIERVRRSNEATLEAQRKRLELEHLRHELEVARQIQLGMLPLSRPMFPDRDDLKVAAIMEPTSAIGGDLFDVFFVDQDRLFLCVGDVSGHGTPAALFMARTVSLLRQAATHAAMPDQLLSGVNEHLCTGNDSGMFVTLFCAFLDVRSGRLIYSNAGHCAPFVACQDEARALPLPKGMLLGVMSGLEFSSMEAHLAADDVLICFTDGVIEAQTAAGEEFSDVRLHEVVVANRHADVERLLDLVRESVTAFTGKAGLDDDCTLLAVRRA